MNYEQQMENFIADGHRSMEEAKEISNRAEERQKRMLAELEAIRRLMETLVELMARPGGLGAQRTQERFESLVEDSTE